MAPAITLPDYADDVPAPVHTVLTSMVKEDDTRPQGIPWACWTTSLDNTRDVLDCPLPTSLRSGRLFSPQCSI